MRITEAAKSTGLSADTIRYYEQEGIVPPIARDASGHRQFTKENVDWMIVLYWLRKTGMSMEVMSRYAALVHAGDHTIPERKQILWAHEKILADRAAEIARCKEILAYKIGAYEKAEEGKPDVKL